MIATLQPSWTERARSLLATVDVATLSTGCPRTGTTTTPVPLEDRGDGLPLLRLHHTSPAVAGLARCRVATLVVSAPGEAWGLRLHVSFRMQAPDSAGVRDYEPTLLSVRVTGPRPRTIPVSEFLRTAPDPAYARNECLLAHLGSAHADDLVAHVRGLADAVDPRSAGLGPVSPSSVRPRSADVVLPVGLDGDVLDVVVLGDDGVTPLRLDASKVCTCAVTEASLPFLE